MNPEQIKSATRWLVGAFGAGIAGFIAGKGWATKEQIMGVLTSDLFLQVTGLAVSLVVGALGLNAHSTVNTIVAASKVDAVKEVAIADSALAQEVKEKTENLDVKVVAKQS